MSDEISLADPDLSNADVATLVAESVAELAVETPIDSFIEQARKLVRELSKDAAMSQNGKRAGDCSFDDGSPPVNLPALDANQKEQFSQAISSLSDRFESGVDEDEMWDAIRDALTNDPEIDTKILRQAPLMWKMGRNGYGSQKFK